MTQSANDYTAVSNSLVAGLQQESDELRRIIIDVRNALTDLFDGRFQPSQVAIDEATSPLYAVHEHFWKDDNDS